MTGTGIETKAETETDRNSRRQSWKEKIKDKKLFSFSLKIDCYQVLCVCITSFPPFFHLSCCSSLSSCFFFLLISVLPSSVSQWRSVNSFVTYKNQFFKGIHSTLSYFVVIILCFFLSSFFISYIFPSVFLLILSVFSDISLIPWRNQVSLLNDAWNWKFPSQSQLQSSQWFTSLTQIHMTVSRLFFLQWLLVLLTFLFFPFPWVVSVKVFEQNLFPKICSNHHCLDEKRYTFSELEKEKSRGMTRFSLFYPHRFRITLFKPGLLL